MAQLTELGILATLLLQFFVFLRWLHRRMRDDDINRQFLRDVATNHLPHIYEALEKIAAKDGIRLELPPAVQWVDFRDNQRNGA